MAEKISAEILKTFAQPDLEKLEKDYQAALQTMTRKIVVMDDDPTGVQTVHNIPVYTDWEAETFRRAFAEDGSMFFILTNSRGLGHDASVEQHKTMARNIVEASKATGKDYVMISRSDSTLRGHYPAEPATLRENVSALSGKKFDGEIIYPFFKEGGRFTINNVHYVQEGDTLVPAGMTEFAKDKTFGYQASHLGEWCEEKSGGAYKARDMIYISLDDLRALNYDRIQQQLESAKDYNKIIVNSIDYCDVKAFTIALIRALNNGHEFIIRSAAAITKVLGGVPDKPLLTRDELVDSANKNGGIVLIGSHVNKTTQQFNELKNSKYPLHFFEFNVKKVFEENGLENEAKRITKEVEALIEKGESVVVYTSRERLDLTNANKEEQLAISVRISDSFISIVGDLQVQPSFIIAKGGITSSDVGTKALKVKRALVMGQIKPGIPVWMTDSTSKFPMMPYVIFPGNVGFPETLREVTETLMK